MFAYCSLTKAGTASPGQLAVCGGVPGQCHLQRTPPQSPTDRAGHAAFVEWSHCKTSARFAFWLGISYPGTCRNCRCYAVHFAYNRTSF